MSSPIIVPKTFICSTLLSILTFGILSGCAPEITSFTPSSAQQGETVTIYGKHFETDAAKDTIRFGTTLAEVIGIPTKDTIRTKVPPGAVTGYLRIKTPRGEGQSVNNFVVLSPKKWTMLVYIDADNNLEGDGLDDFMEMASVGSTSAVNIVVQMDRTPDYASSYNNWTDTRRFYIRKNDTPSSPPVAILGEKNMGDPAVLQDFVTWGVTHYPAEHYLLVIWNHGGGWKELQQRLASVRTAQARSAGHEAIVKEVAYDDTDADFLYMKELQQALEASKENVNQRYSTFVKLDIVGFDACLMGMVEVGYALRNTASYMVGSEELEPGSGWPYDTILRDLTANPGMSPKQLCETIVAKYVDSYPASSDVTLSALDQSQILTLSAGIDAFTTAAQSEWDKVKLARANARQYHPGGFSTWGTDLRAFASNVNTNATSASLRLAATALGDAVAQCVIAERHGQGCAGSFGLAIYFPPDQASYDNDPEHSHYTQGNAYMPVDFVQQHFWDEWLPVFYRNTANIP